MTENSSTVSSVKSLATATGRLTIDGKEFEETFQPAFDWCLIKMTDRSESLPQAMKDAGLVEIIQVRQQARNKDGVIIRMGPHEHDSDYKKVGEPCFKVGDRVYYGSWAGQETPCPEGYILVKSKDLKAWLDPKARIEWI